VSDITFVGLDTEGFFACEIFFTGAFDGLLGFVTSSLSEKSEAFDTSFSGFRTEAFFAGNLCFGAFDRFLGFVSKP
jgi:hypothetical protein